MPQHKKESDDLSPLDKNRREHPSTYFVQDRSSLDEMTRLRIQDQMFTASMGGVLSEQSDPTQFQRVLDVGCGTGGWLIEVAKMYPHMKRLVGIDISTRMLEYARAQAEEQGLGDRIEFAAMDALRMLEFPPNTFDLVNQRAGLSWVRKWDWPNMLSKYQRVWKPGGVIRATEANFTVGSSSPALNQIHQLLLQSFYQAGNFFTPQADGIISHLAPLFTQYGIQNVQTRSYPIEYHAGTSEGQHYIDDATLASRTILPFLR